MVYHGGTGQLHVRSAASADGCAYQPCWNAAGVVEALCAGGCHASHGKDRGVWQSVALALCSRSLVVPAEGAVAAVMTPQLDLQLVSEPAKQAVRGSTVALLVRVRWCEVMADACSAFSWPRAGLGSFSLLCLTVGLQLVLGARRPDGGGRRRRRVVKETIC